MLNIAKRIVNFFYPSKCIVCKKLLSIDNDINICSSCLMSLPYIKKPCKKCGKPKETYLPYCIDCTRLEYNFEKCISVFEYIEPVRTELIYFKSKGSREYAKVFGSLMANAYKKANLVLPDYIIPVPIHIKKLKRKGFNHSLLLAKHIGYNINAKVIDNVLIKDKNTDLQKKLSHNGRKTNIKGAFKARNSNIIFNKNILLVDDIYTTGATVNECSKVLKEKGAKRVSVIVLASGIGY